MNANPTGLAKNSSAQALNLRPRLAGLHFCSEAIFFASAPQTALAVEPEPF